MKTSSIGNIGKFTLGGKNYNIQALKKNVIISRKGEILGSYSLFNGTVGEVITLNLKNRGLLEGIKISELHDAAWNYLKSLTK